MHGNIHIFQELQLKKVPQWCEDDSEQRVSFFDSYNTSHMLYSSLYCLQPFASWKNHHREFCDDPDPHRVRTVTTTNSENKWTEFSPKTGPYPGLKPYKLDLQELQFNIHFFFKAQRPHARVTTQRVTTPGVHNQPYIKECKTY